MLSEPMRVVAELARILEAIGVEYVVGGSLASSVYGVPRATEDVDLVADLGRLSVEPLLEQLGEGFYADADRIRLAAENRSSFNVIHLATMFKADIFVMKRDAWSEQQMARARRERLAGPEGPVEVRFASPEDVLLHKLTWYRLGDEASDRQWSDIEGICRVQGNLLDEEYLDRWAARLGVADLLQRVRELPDL